MLKISVKNDTQQECIEHDGGPLEIGRGPQREHKRFVVDDAFFSRDQLRLEELPTGRVRLENLSRKNALNLSHGKILPVGATLEVDPPIQLKLGKTTILIEGIQESVQEELVDEKSLMTVSQPILRREQTIALSALTSMGEPLTPERITHWLEAIISFQRSSSTTEDLCREIAVALVDLVGLDEGMVLQLEEGEWKLLAHHAVKEPPTVRFSRSLLKHVCEQRQTFYQDIGSWSQKTISLSNVAAVVVSPVFGLHDEVIGALYGIRSGQTLVRVGPIKPLEAQVVQLLAAAIGANLARAVATRTRIQFEQFFSPQLVQELERDPDLLEGRSQEVTILVSDLRGFSSLSQRLGASKTCSLMRDMMERLSERIVEEGGVIVDYAGDGILAMWNAPAAQPDHALRACRAALAMQAEMPGLNETWHETVGVPLRLGIGLNTGEAQVGNTGSKRKFKYGPHGHTVNLASRIQDTTKKLGIPILITESTRRSLPPEMAVRRLGKVYVAGISEPVMIYELAGASPSADWLKQKDVYEKALEAYEKGEWARACQTLTQILELSDPHTQKKFDTPTLKLMRQAWGCLEQPPDPFDPILELPQ